MKKRKPLLTPAFYPTQSTLVSGLRIVSTSICGYRGPVPGVPVRCDCKYGIGVAEHRNSEQNGCPETAAAAALVEVLSAKEFERLVKRAQLARRVKK